MKISRLFLPFMIAIAGCATQNPPAKIDTERQAKIEKALEQLKNKDEIQAEQEEEIIFYTHILDYGIAPGEGWELKK